MVVSRATRASSACASRNASSARLRSVMSIIVPTNSRSPDASVSGCATLWTCLTTPSGRASRYSCWNARLSRTALSRRCSSAGRSSGCTRSRYCAVGSRSRGRIEAEDARVFGRPAHLAGAHVPAPAAGMADLLPFGEGRLARPERFFGPLALDELADLAADGRHHVEQVLVGLPYLVAEELHDPQDVSAEQDGKAEGRVQPFARGDGARGKFASSTTSGM